MSCHVRSRSPCDCRRLTPAAAGAHLRGLVEKRRPSLDACAAHHQGKKKIQKILKLCGRRAIGTAREGQLGCLLGAAALSKSWHGLYFSVS